MFQINNKDNRTTYGNFLLILKKHPVGKILLVVQETFFVRHIPYKFSSFVEKENKNKIFSNTSVFVLIIVSCTLLHRQAQAKFNILFLRNFLTYLKLGFRVWMVIWGINWSSFSGLINHLQNNSSAYFGIVQVKN